MLPENFQLHTGRLEIFQQIGSEKDTGERNLYFDMVVRFSPGVRKYNFCTPLETFCSADNLV